MDEALPFLHRERNRLEAELRQTKAELAVAKESLRRMAGEMRDIQRTALRQVEAASQERDDLRRKLEAALGTHEDATLLVNVLKPS